MWLQLMLARKNLASRVTIVTYWVHSISELIKCVSLTCLAFLFKPDKTVMQFLTKNDQLTRLEATAKANAI